MDRILLLNDLESYAAVFRSSGEKKVIEDALSGPRRKNAGGMNLPDRSYVDSEKTPIQPEEG